MSDPDAEVLSFLLNEYGEDFVTRCKQESAENDIGLVDAFEVLKSQQYFSAAQAVCEIGELECDS